MKSFEWDSQTARSRSSTVENSVMLDEPDEDVLRVLDEYKSLIQRIAKSAYTSSPTIEYTDLCQVGELAAINAIRLYDPTRGSKFSSYVSRAIRIGIYNEAARFLGVFTVDHRVTELAAKVIRFTEQGKTDEEIAEQMSQTTSRNFDVEHVRDLRLAYSRRQAYSINEEVSEDPYGEPAYPVEEILKSVTKNEVDEIVLRDKLLGSKTVDEVATLAGVSVRTVSRIEIQLRERIECAIKKVVDEESA